MKWIQCINDLVLVQVGLLSIVLKEGQKLDRLLATNSLRLSKFWDASNFFSEMTNMSSLDTASTSTTLSMAEEGEGIEDRK